MYHILFNSEIEGLSKISKQAKHINIPRACFKPDCEGKILKFKHLGCKKKCITPHENIIKLRYYPNEINM